MCHPHARRHTRRVDGLYGLGVIPGLVQRPDQTILFTNAQRAGHVWPGVAGSDVPFPIPSHARSAGFETALGNDPDSALASIIFAPHPAASRLRNSGRNSLAALDCLARKALPARRGVALGATHHSRTSFFPRIHHRVTTVHCYLRPGSPDGPFPGPCHALSDSFDRLPAGGDRQFFVAAFGTPAACVEMVAATRVASSIEVRLLVRDAGHASGFLRQTRFTAINSVDEYTSEKRPKFCDGNLVLFRWVRPL